MTASIYICLSALSLTFCNNVLVLSQQTNPVDANRYVNPTYQIQSAGNLPPQPLVYNGNPPTHDIPPLFPNVPPLIPNVPPLFPNVPPLFPNIQPSAYSGNVPTHNAPPIFPNVPPLFPNDPPPQPPPPPLPMPPPPLSITPPSTLVAPPPNAQIPQHNEMRHAVFHHPPIENTPQHSVNETSGPSLSPVNSPKLIQQKINSIPSQTQYHTVQSQQQELIKNPNAMKKPLKEASFIDNNSIVPSPSQPPQNGQAMNYSPQWPPQQQPNQQQQGQQQQPSQQQQPIQQQPIQQPPIKQQQLTQQQLIQQPPIQQQQPIQPQQPIQQPIQQQSIQQPIQQQLIQQQQQTQLQQPIQQQQQIQQVQWQQQQLQQQQMQPPYQQQGLAYEYEQPELQQVSKFGTSYSSPTNAYGPAPRPEYEAVELEATTPSPQNYYYQQQNFPPIQAPIQAPSSVSIQIPNQISLQVPSPISLQAPPRPVADASWLKAKLLQLQQTQAYNAPQQRPAPVAPKTYLDPRLVLYLRNQHLLAQQRKLASENLMRSSVNYAHSASAQTYNPQFQSYAPSSGSVQEVYEMLSTGEMKCKNLYRLHNIDGMRQASSVCGRGLRCPAPYNREVQMGNFCMCCPYLDPATMSALQQRQQQRLLY